MPENDRLSGCLDEINLEFVEREAHRSRWWSSVFSFISEDYRFRILFCSFRYSVLIGFDLPFITGFTRPIYSRDLVGARITLRLMKQWFNLTTNNIGCTPPSIPAQTIYSTRSLNRQEW